MAACTCRYFRVVRCRPPRSIRGGGTAQASQPWLLAWNQARDAGGATPLAYNERTKAMPGISLAHTMRRKHLPNDPSFIAAVRSKAAGTRFRPLFWLYTGPLFRVPHQSLAFQAHVHHMGRVSRWKCKEHWGSTIDASRIRSNGRPSRGGLNNWPGVVEVRRFVSRCLGKAEIGWSRNACACGAIAASVHSVS